MAKVSKVLVVIGCLLILTGVISQFASCPIKITSCYIRPISLVIMANATFLLALLLKK